MANLAARLKKFLDATGLSQEGLADKIGCSLATIYRWRDGTSKKPHRAALRAFEALEAAIAKKR